MSERLSDQVTKQRISELLDELPPASLRSVENFVRSLREREPLSPGPVYPTVENPASSLNAWLDLVPEGYEGDALADTEAMYDEDRDAGRH